MKKVLSVCDVISCGREALKRVGIEPELYYASEIEKPAITVAQKNYPDTVQLGDMTDWFFWDIALEDIDLLMAGTPCTGFSVAGKHLNFEDPQSKLFFDFVDILEAITTAREKVGRPAPKFLLENVKMKQDWLDVITSRLDVDPMFINSASVSGQNRQRYYWFNWEAEQPDDRGISFQSCLDSDEARLPKAPALTRTYHKGGGEATRQRQFERKQRPIAWLNDNTTRWLTPEECEALQTLPRGYTEGISKTARLQTLGNAWNVETVSHILSFLPEAEDLGL